VLAAEKDTLKQLVVQLHDRRLALREAIAASDATEQSVRAAAARLAAAQAEFAVERFKLHGKIGPILTAEQRAKVKQFQARLDDFIDNAINRFGERSGTR
jgi:Spy/CpxP family protein refolding chaperone